MSTEENISFDWIGVTDVETDIVISVTGFGERNVTYRDGKQKLVKFVYGKVKDHEELGERCIKINNYSWKFMRANDLPHLKRLIGLDVTFEKVTGERYDWLQISKV